MATTYSWGYTNTTDSLVTVTLKKLNEYSDYGRSEDTPDKCVLSNKTSPLDQKELVSFMFNAQNINSSNLTYPPLSRDGVRYVTKVEDIKRETRDDGSMYDHPIKVSLAVQHDTAYNWTNADILAVLARALGACYNETSGEWRFEDLMRSALAPTED